ncbi:MAG: FG-GAP repeat protein, partial [Phycisphaerales bacterium]|nr:FG-GAP repeat protein [Phycisphaerales bacterium]
ATGGASGDQFGSSVAIDGDTCVISAPESNSDTGSAYVFTKSDGTWSQAAELTATGGASGDQFGSSVAIDGDTCVISASESNSYTGSAYVYGSGSSAVDNDGACCYDGLCFSITESECTAVGGSFTAEACSADTACPTACSSDSDNDGDVDIEDLMTLLATFGACP